MAPIRVLIVDDHIVVREGIRAMLQTAEEIEVVGEASDGLEALTKTEEWRPDAVLMDLRMPNLDGLEATRQIKERYPDTSVIMLTMYSDEAFVIDSVRAGASGYLMKDASRDLLCHAVRAVTSGGSLIKSSLLREAMADTHKASSHDSERSVAPMVGSEPLTAREQEVLRLLVDGYTNKAIAHELYIAEETAKKHVQSIISKLGASDRTQAAVRAVRSGLLETESADSRSVLLKY